MRITLVSETYFPQINGVSRTLDRLVRHLRQQGDEIQLLIPRYDALSDVPDDSVEIRPFDGVRFPLYREVLLPFTRTATVEKALEAFAPDLVHIATEGPLGLAALRAARRLGLPVASSYHTNFSTYLGKYRLSLLSRMCWRYLRWFHNATGATFCPTPSIRAILEDKGFDSVQIWSRGVDASRFHPELKDNALRSQLGIRPGEKVLLYVGRLAAEKNLDTLLSAWESLPAGHGSRLLLVGDGPMRETMQRRCDDRVIFAGYRQGEELARIYALADLFVFPSLSETFGNVMLEAMASGVPVLAFRAPGPQDVVTPGQTGMLVDEITADAFGRALYDLMSRDDERCAMGTRAREFACGQNWQQINDGVRRVYGELVKQHAATQPCRTPGTGVNTRCRAL